MALLSQSEGGIMWKKLRKHSVIFSDGTYRDLSMTPEMAKKLVDSRTTRFWSSPKTDGLY